MGTSDTFRTELDPLGAVQIPADALWGAQTQRARDNFPISGQAMPRRIVRALALIKRAAAQVNRDLGVLAACPGRRHHARGRARSREGQHDPMFPVDVFQTGSGTSTHMNVNEVIANRAIQLLGGTIGSKSPVHPNDHVNLGQSSNDVFPSAVHIAAAEAVARDLMPALRELAEPAAPQGHAAATRGQGGPHASAGCPAHPAGSGADGLRHHGGKRPAPGGDGPPARCTNWRWAAPRSGTGFGAKPGFAAAVIARPGRARPACRWCRRPTCVRRWARATAWSSCRRHCAGPRSA